MKKLLCSILLAGLLAAPVSVLAQAQVHSLVLTETSPTSLSVTFDGAPVSVTLQSSDNWLISLPMVYSAPLGSPNVDPAVNAALGLSPALANNINDFWLEPGGDHYNFIDSGNPGRGIAIISDFTPGPNFPTFSSAENGGSQFWANDSAGIPIMATFIDNATEPNGVPDAASTVSLLLLSLGGICSLAKRELLLRLG